MPWCGRVTGTLGDRQLGGARDGRKVVIPTVRTFDPRGETVIEGILGWDLLLCTYVLVDNWSIVTGVAGVTGLLLLVICHDIGRWYSLIRSNCTG